MSAVKTTPVTARLSDEQVQQIEKLAKEQNRKRSYFIQQAVAAYLERAAA